MDKKIIIGKIVAPHGVRGDLRILPLTEKPEQFLNLKYLLLPDGHKLTLQHTRFHKHVVLVKAKEICSMNDAELLRGKEVLIYVKDLPKLAEGQYYVADLIGIPVYTENGDKIGIFKESFNAGSTDVYVIETLDKNNILLPAISAYIKEINVAENRIVVNLPEWTDAE